MPLGLLFWILWLFCLLFGGYGYRAELAAGKWGGFGGSLLLWALLFILGWRVFGFVVSG